ncbi:hypothetical protein L198_03704 [Cryptococcus wingfieldii CBS 7118]|uniref:Zn(2)-C6 fungal-type domain-containing protein n=1 Tax=Cryptococcus wingfieldii CBS 7118 TaxID=1295528 RepID=A0A1E3JC79_9TREE|nr:hypothetical protein L198_03704 [Cryptococcus wingfieldii CBS 7118]ODN98459.1 hypothetical protein L198_03704 [Cryptococcus wingfieldii CBS 7118]
MLPGEQRYVPSRRPSPTPSEGSGLPSLATHIQAPEAPPHAPFASVPPGEELLLYSLNFPYDERERLRQQGQTALVQERHQRPSLDSPSQRPESMPSAPHQPSRLLPGTAPQQSTPPGQSPDVAPASSGGVLPWNYDTVRAYWMGYASAMKDIKAGRENAWGRLQKQGKWQEIKRRHAPYPHAPSPPRPPSPELSTLRQAAPSVISSLAGMRQQQGWRPPQQTPLDTVTLTPGRPRTTVPVPARQYPPEPFSPPAYRPPSRPDMHDMDVHGQRGGWGTYQPVYLPIEDQTVYPPPRDHLPAGYHNAPHAPYPAAPMAASPRVHPPPFSIGEPSHHPVHGDRFNVHPSGEGSTSEFRLPRKRQLISCYPCRKRKLRCDGRKPICEQCERRKVASECGYAESVKRRGKGKSADGRSEEEKKEDEADVEVEVEADVEADVETQAEGDESEVPVSVSRSGRYESRDSHHARATRGRSSSSSARPLATDAEIGEARRQSKEGDDEEMEQK